MSNDAATDEIALEPEHPPSHKSVDDVGTVASADAGTKRKSSLAVLKIAVYLVILLTSAIPSYLVLRQRWLENTLNIDSVNEFWNDSPLLSSFAYPQYFLLIFASTLLTIIALFAWRDRYRMVYSNLHVGTAETGIQPNSQRLEPGRYLLTFAMIAFDVSAIWMLVKQRIPSWDLLIALALFVGALVLMERGRPSLQAYLRAHGKFLLDAALLVVALCSALYAAFGDPKPNVIFYILLGFAVLNFLQYRRQTPMLFWVCIAALVALTWNINDWHYVVIGDEYSFLIAIQGNLDKLTPRQLIDTLFNGTFVYGTHPYLSSHIQNFFMKLFDNRNFGWRFSNPALVVLSLPLYYYFFKAFVPRKFAILIVSMLGFSHYLLSFSKIGYNNLQALFVMGAVLAAFVWALRSMRRIAFCITGLAMGICCYVYPAALYAIPLPVIGFLIFMPPTNRAAIKRWAWMILSFAMLFYPLIVQPEYWEAKVAGTFLYTEAGYSLGAFIDNFSRNMMYSGFSYLYMPEHTHFVSIGYLDLLSSVFIVIGVVVLSKIVLQGNKPALFLMLSFLYMFMIVGATHGRHFPTATRMFLLLPWWVMLVAFGVRWVAESAHQLFRLDSRKMQTVLVGSIVLVNIYHAYVIDIWHMPQYHTMAPLFIKIARQIDADINTPPKSYAFVGPHGWNTDGIMILQGTYLVPDSPRQIIHLPIDEGNQLLATAQELVSQRDIVVIVKSDIDQDIVNHVNAQLASWGKTMCEMRNERGILQFYFWHSGDLGWVCQ